jgi:uncharacterized protein (DUF433 family)
MSPASDNQFVNIDEHGVLRVGATRVMLDSVVAGFHQGLSPESIQQQYPALTLQEVYGAITYYLGHREEVADYLTRQSKVWQQAKDNFASRESSDIRRLRAMAHDKANLQS